MASTVQPLAAFFVQEQHPRAYRREFVNKSSSSIRRKERFSFRCSGRQRGAETGKPGGKDEDQKKKKKKGKNYYELLGISVDSQPTEIKSAYRNLQKKYHPDVAGQQAHEYTLMLNEAYRILMEENLRNEYDSSIGLGKKHHFRSNGSGSIAYSSWNGPLRPEALFVNENACIGCRECVHYASKTFMIDEALGSARVKVQYGDDDEKIEVAVDSCPVNCIHWVEAEELPVLEFLIQPQPKQGNGVFGQGWERPDDVFMAAKDYNKKLKNKREQQAGNGGETGTEETVAQVDARARASIKIRMEKFSWVWNWLRKLS